MTLAAGLMWAAFVVSPAMSTEATDESVPRSECGPLCLQACAALTGRAMSYERVTAAVGKLDEIDGTSLGRLRQAAEHLDLSTAAVRWHEAPPEAVSAPAILPVKLPSGTRHFVALVRTRDEMALVLDFPHPASWMSLTELRTKYAWDGTALYVAGSEEELAGVHSRIGFRWRYGVAGLAAAAAVLFLFRRLGGRDKKG